MIKTFHHYDHDPTRPASAEFGFVVMAVLPSSPSPPPLLSLFVSFSHPNLAVIASQSNGDVKVVVGKGGARRSSEEVRLRKEWRREGRRRREKGEDEGGEGGRGRSGGEARRGSEGRRRKEGREGWGWRNGMGMEAGDELGAFFMFGQKVKKGVHTNAEYINAL